MAAMEIMKLLKTNYTTIRVQILEIGSHLQAAAGFSSEPEVKRREESCKEAKE